VPHVGLTGCTYRPPPVSWVCVCSISGIYLLHSVY
jgi:hypothetical protein